MFPVLKIEIEKSNLDGMLYAKISEDEREYPILQLGYEDYDEICSLVGVTPTNEKDELTIAVEADEGGLPMTPAADDQLAAVLDEIAEIEGREGFEDEYAALMLRGAPRER